MIHVCHYEDGECERCVVEAADEFERDLKSRRGRWMVVDEAGFVLRFRRKSEARVYVSLCRAAGLGARFLRWNRSRVHLSREPFAGYEASDERWWP